MVLELGELLKLWSICELRVYQSHPDHLKSNIQLCTLPSTKKIKYILDNTFCTAFHRLKELRKQHTQQVWKRVNKQSWGLNNDVWGIVLSYSEEFHIDWIIQIKHQIIDQAIRIVQTIISDNEYDIQWPDPWAIEFKWAKTAIESAMHMIKQFEELRGVYAIQ